MNTIRERFASIRAFFVTASVLLVVTGVASLAIAQSSGEEEPTGPSSHKYAGLPGAATTATKTQVPPEARAAGSPSDWGAMVYESRGGLVCVAAGPVVSGRVGRVTEAGGFRPLRAEDAPGNCGDRDDDLTKWGAMVFTHHSPSAPRAQHPVGLAYGVVAPDVERVLVRPPHGSERTAELSAVSGIEGVSGAFSVPLPKGMSEAAGLVVVIERAGGSREEIRF